MPPAVLLRAALIACAIAFVLAACDVAAPERPIASDVPKQSVQSYALDALDALDSREAYAGSIIVDVPDDAFGEPIDQMHLYVDGDLVSKREQPPWRLGIRTESYADGPHEVAIGVRFQGQKLGMLAFVDGLPTVYVDTLVFDQTPPSVVDADLSLSGDTARVTWSRPPERNLAGYVVYHSGNRSSFSWRSTFVADTLAPSATEYVGTHGDELVYGREVSYRVDAFNGAETATGIETKTYPDVDRMVDLSDKEWGIEDARVFAVPGEERALVHLGETLYDVDAQTVRVSRSVEITALHDDADVLDYIVFNPEGTRIYARLRNDRENRFFLVELDPQTLRPRSSHAFPTRLNYSEQAARSGFIRAGRDGRVYVMTRFEDLVVYDGDTGSEVGRLSIDSDAYRSRVVNIQLSRDGRTLYVVQRERGQTLHSTVDRIHIIDVSSPTPRHLRSGVVRSPSRHHYEAPRHLRRVPGSDDLYVGYGRSGYQYRYDYRLFDVETATDAGTVEFPEDRELIAVSDQSHYLSSWNAGATAQEIVQMDADLSTVKGRWFSFTGNVGTSRDDAYLYALHQDLLWALPTTE